MLILVSNVNMTVVDYIYCLMILIPEDFRLTTDIPSIFAAEMTYVNLQLNPERYTGYTGPSARRIWDAIYSENCPKCELFSLFVLCHIFMDNAFSIIVFNGFR